MNYFDLHINSEFSEGESSIEQIAKRAKLLGYKGFCIVENYKMKNNIEKLKKEISEISKKEKIEILLGFEATNEKELNKLREIRKEYDILVAKGGNPNFNRKAVETKEVDILSHPEKDSKKDSGFNHIMAKLARKNNVAIEINFREIMQCYKKSRVSVLHKIQSNVKICKKYKCPLILTSGALSHLHIKDPIVLTSMGTMLELNLNDSKKTLSDIPKQIIESSKKKQNKKWIMPGVELE